MKELTSETWIRKIGDGIEWSNDYIVGPFNPPNLS